MKSKYKPENQLTLYNGDCLKFLETLLAESAQLVVTSPPYNVGKDYEIRASLDEYLTSQGPVIRECHRVIKKSGSICWQVGNNVENGEVVPLDIYFYPIFKSLGIRLQNRIIWTFGHGLNCTNRFSGRYETILWFTKSNDYFFNLDAGSDLLAPAILKEELRPLDLLTSSGQRHPFQSSGKLCGTEAPARKGKCGCSPSTEVRSRDLREGGETVGEGFGEGGSVCFGASGFP